MKLSERQRAFTAALTKLFAWIHENGYEFTLGDAWAKTGHVTGSYHYQRLAVDLNLFIDNKYQTSTTAHTPIGEEWERLGGTWGGRFRVKDGNHYSWGESKR